MATDKQTIVDLETRFWQSMKDKDPESAKSMIADQGLVVGPMGTLRMDPAKYGKMTEEGQWTLKSFEMKDLDVVMPNSDTAIVAYEVHQTGDMKGQPMDMRCADSTVWVRDGGDWKVALHTETILQDSKVAEPA